MVGHRKLAALIASLLLSQWLSAEAAQAADTGDPQAGRPPVEPFDDQMLPPGQRQGEHVPGLGRVMQLDTYIGPKSALSMATTFYIYTQGRALRGLKFRAVDPAPAAGPAELARDGAQYQYDLALLRDVGFDPTKRTIVMIPGYLSKDEEQWAREATRKLLELHPDGVNVVAVSWTDSNKCVYSQAVAHTIFVARQVTVLLHYLAQLAGVQLTDSKMLDNLHLIGHSLGAHIVGFVGQDLGGRAGRITGLDPAGPSFDSFPPNQRLDRADAQLVEVLHTNMGQMKYLKAIASAPFKLLSSLFSTKQVDSSRQAAGDQSEYSAWFGIAFPTGHLDYYANNGRVQLGCTGSLHICDHGRAGEIFVDLLRLQSAQGSLGLANASVDGQLLAFDADTYESFESGQGFAGHCQQLLSAEGHLDASQEAGLAGCSAPLLDMRRPFGELIEALKTRHGINFEAGAYSEAAGATRRRPRFYFKTSAGSFARPLEPSTQTQFVAHHYLAKVYLARAADWPPAAAKDGPVCTLRVQLLMPDDERVSLEVGALEGRPRVLALPFLHPRGFGARRELEQMLASWRAVGRAHEPADRNQDEFARHFQDHFPRTITLSIAQSQRNASPSACELLVAAVEVHPIQGAAGQNVGALYGGRLALAAERLPVVQTGEFARRLAGHGSPPSLQQALKLAANSEFSSFGFGLEAALVPGQK